MSHRLSGVRTINTAEVSYFSAYRPRLFLDAAKLGDGGVACPAPSNALACLIDNVLANAGVAPGKSGYSTRRLVRFPRSRRKPIRSHKVRQACEAFVPFRTQWFVTSRVAPIAACSVTELPLQ